MSACPILTDETRIGETILGGWSNINLEAYLGSMKMVIKLPAVKTVHSRSHYDRIAKNHSALADIGLAPRVLATGFLDDLSLPFMILEYVDGTVYSSPAEISSHEMNELRHALERMNAINSPALPYYPDAVSFLDHILQPLRNLTMHSSDSVRINTILSHVLEIAESLRDACDGVPWSRRVMHGDLSESNILFTIRGPFFLDLESISIGEPLFDLAYLSVQHADVIVPRMAVIHEMIDSNTIKILQSMALVAVIGWSLVWSSHMDQGLVESAVATEARYRSIIRYTDSKYQLLEEWSQSIS